MLNQSSNEHTALANIIVRNLESRRRRCCGAVSLNLVLALVLFPSCWLQKQITHYDSVQTQNHKKATVKDSYHLPHIPDTLDMLCGNNLFTTLDLLKGYHQIEVEESSRKKTAFTTHVGFFYYICLHFGLTNTPAFFQRLLEHVLWDYIGKYVILYIDGILIFNASFEDHLSHVVQVLQTLREAYLKVWTNKCKFAWNSVKFLGRLITPEEIGPNKRNIEVVTFFPTPVKTKDVCALIGLCNYCRRFIKNYSVLGGSLIQLLKKNAVFCWHSPQHESFLALKKRLTTVPILAYPDFSIPFTLYTDASGDSIGFNLTQVQHGKERVIVYGGWNFSDTEKKYSVTEREALSVIVAI